MAVDRIFSTGSPQAYGYLRRLHRLGSVARLIARVHMPQALLNNEAVLHSTPFRFDMLLVGALIALLYRGAYREEMQRAAQGILAIAMVAALSVYIYWFRFHHPIDNAV